MKTAFITGANRGLGRGFVEYLLNEGFTVFAGMRDINNFDSNNLPNPENLHLVQIDISDDASIKAAVEEIKKHTDSLNYLVNNAGVNKDSATDNHKELVSNLANLDRELLLDMFNVNTISPLLVTKAVLPLLNSEESFAINISSIRGWLNDVTTSGNYGYRASKAALNMMTVCSLVDLPANIKTFAVHPGNVNTDMNPEGNQNPQEQAKSIMQIAFNWDDSKNGKFLKYDGSLYP